MRCSGESQQVVDAALLPSAGTQKGYRGTCSSHFIFNPPTFLEMCSELGFAFPFICPCNDFFYCSSYSRCMWSGGSSRNLLSLIKRWVFDGILNADFRYRSVCGVLRPQMEAAEPCSECIIHKCLKKHNFIRPRCSEVLSISSMVPTLIKREKTHKMWILPIPRPWSEASGAFPWISGKGWAFP